MFTRDTVLLTPPARYCDEDGDWTDPATLTTEPASFPASPWSWYGPATRVTGPAWDGNVEIVDFHLRTGRYLLPEKSYEGAVLFLETSEEMPPAIEVYRVLMCRASGSCRSGSPPSSGGDRGRGHGEAAGCFRESAVYAGAARRGGRGGGGIQPGGAAGFGVDFGHTEPQFVIPSGGTVTVDGVSREIYVTC